MPKSPLQAFIWLSRILQKKKNAHKKTGPGGELGKSKDKKQNEKACKIQKGLPSLKTNSLYLKMDGWNTSFLLGPGLFSGSFVTAGDSSERVTKSWKVAAVPAIWTPSRGAQTGTYRVRGW